MLNNLADKLVQGAKYKSGMVGTTYTFVKQSDINKNIFYFRTSDNVTIKEFTKEYVNKFFTAV